MERERVTATAEALSLSELTAKGGFGFALFHVRQASGRSSPTVPAHCRRSFQAEFLAFAVEGCLVDPEDFGGFAEVRSAFQDFADMQFLQFVQREK